MSTHLSKPPTIRMLPRPGRHRLVAGLTLLLTLSACAAPDAATDSTESTTGGTAQTAAVDAGLSDPTVGLTTIGWLDSAGPFGELSLGAADITTWPELLMAVSAPAGPGGLTVTSTVEREPDACTLWRVIVSDVSFGQGAGAERMRASVLATLSGIDHDPGPLLGPDEEPWCGDRPLEGRAWYATVITPSFCELPGADTLRCVTVTTMRYDGGAHPNTIHTDLVLDGASGDLLTVDSLLTTLDVDVATATAFIEAAVCDLDIAAGLVDVGDGCWPITLRNARPTPAGLILSFAPYESGPYAIGPRDLFVPWAELEAGASVPVATRAAQRDLRGALAAGDWSTVAALLPSDGDFLVASAQESDDPIAVLRGLPRDPRPEILAVLAQRPGRIAGTTVWPELAVRDPFVIDAAERPLLEAAFGSETVTAWESAGRYLGWRAGFADDGSWRFIVAGD